MPVHSQSHIRTRGLIGGLHLSLLFACATRTVAVNSSKSPPHVVFILADDLGWGDVSFHGSPQIPTPNIDALASTGVVLNNYYVQPTCSPSRGALLSGRYCIHIGFQDSPLLPRQLGGLPLDIKIMPEYFKELGYEPHIPLFLYLAHQATHGGVGPEPIEAPRENVAKFPYIDEDDRKVYAGMTDALDQSVGIILEALEEASMLRDTIIVFSSDNGGAPTGPISNRGMNWPLRGAKGTLWEGGIRAAAFLWTAELLQRRRVSHQLMHVTDWLPTLYSAAGGDVERLKPLDGFDMWRALTTGEASPRSEILININRQAGESALRYRNWKLVLGDFGDMDEHFEIPGGSRPYGDLDPLMRNSSAAAVLRRLYGKEDVFEHASQWRREATITCADAAADNFASGGNRYLFDIAQDPCELNNLAEERPELFSMLLERLEVYNKTVVPPVDETIDPRGSPEFHDGVWAPWVK
ncbi:arylsulfatase B-like [Dermacentor andersoni]|uniref:arylsulfatase B-like n=1 Tax=Dermacentor andersoni TaxID=34620 RepID=UPI003B39FF70